MKNFVVSSIRYIFLTAVLASLGLYSIYLTLIGCAMFLVLTVLSTMRSSEIPNKSTVKSEELFNFLNDLGDKEFILRSSQGESGAVIHRLGQPNVYIIPRQTNPEQATMESKAVLSHEYSHVKNRHKIKSIIFDMISVSINAVLLTFFPVYTVFILVTLNCLLIYPITRNYLKHRFEYEADNFAVESVSKKAVQHRLRRNSHLEPDNNGFIPYSTSHPEIKTRMDRVHNLDENTRNQDQLS